MTREQKLKAVWTNTHSDYRGTINGTRTIMVLRDGGSRLIAIQDLTDAEIESRLPRAKRA